MDTSKLYGTGTSSSIYGSSSTSAHNKIDRTVVKRTTNQSSFTLSDGNTIGSSLYRRPAAAEITCPCPAAQIDSSTFKHTRDTKSHKFYSTSKII